MNAIRRKVARVWRRLMLERFLKVIGWALAAGLLLGGTGALATKVWVVPWPQAQWYGLWLGCGLGVSLVAAVVVTWLRGVTLLEAAMEIDRRFGLSERVSSCLLLSEEERASAAGQALLADAQRRLEGLELAERFRLAAPWSLAAPIPLALLLAAALWALPDAVARTQSAQEEKTKSVTLVKAQTEKLQQQLKRRTEQLSEQALKDVQDVFTQLERSLEQLRDKPIQDRKEALIQLNELAEQLEKKRQQLGGSDQLRQQMNQLRNLQSGPGDEFAKSLRQGDYRAAVDALKSLQDKLRSGALSAEEQAKLSQQLDAIEKRLQEMQQSYQEARRELERQIEAAQKTGNLEAVNRLQQKLNQLDAMQSQMGQLNRMAEALAEASRQLQQGNSAQAAAAMQQAMDQLAQMQSDLETLKACEAMLSDIEACRGAIAGMGNDDVSLGMLGPSSSFESDREGSMGMGQGRGRGDRPEETTDTQAYETRVAAKLQKGKAVIAGTADGPNVAGQSREAIKEAILSEFREQSDPLTDQQLPRDQREHVKEYFQKYVKP